MGFMIVTSPCFACGLLCSYNPEKVPSYEGKPICASCIAIVNAKRAEMGQPQWPVYPDAYEAQEVG